MQWLAGVFRRLRHLHPATWVASLLAAVVMTLLMVPAGYDRPSYGYRSGNNWDKKVAAVYEETSQWIAHQRKSVSGQSSSRSWTGVGPALRQHGWPVPYLVRSLPPTANLGSGAPYCGIQNLPEPFEYVGWADYDNWPLEMNSWRMSFSRLALNVVTAIFAVVVAGAATQWWQSHRGGLFRFRLLDALGMLTVAAVILGWWAYHSQLQQIEKQALAQLGPHDEEVGPPGYPAYVGPVWLARLVGDEASLPQFNHIIQVNLSAAPAWPQSIEPIRCLPYVRSVELYGNTPQSAVELLHGLPRLERLTLWREPSSEVPFLPNDPLMPEHLDALSCLHLREVIIDWPGIIAEDIKAMLEATELERVHLTTPAITVAELERLRSQYPNVLVSVFWNLPFDHDSPEAEEAIAKVRAARGK